MTTLYWVILAVLAVAAITFFTGPRIPEPVYANDLPAVPETPAAAAGFVTEREAAAPTRPDNEARVEWHGANNTKTKYSIVYLHGFGGSWRDGAPASRVVADSLGANLYQARWGDHGLLPDYALRGMTPDSVWEDAKTALLVGRAIGERVIILSTSTGGTLAIKLAAEFPDLVAAIVNISPNIKDDMPGSWVLNSPCGHELAKLVSFGDRRAVSHEEPAAAQYFDTIFPSRALVDLQVLVSTTMVEETFRRVRCPVLTLYYYKNMFEEDERVEVDVYEDVHAALATPAARQKLLDLPTPGTHWMGCDIKSQDVASTQDAIIEWLRSGVLLPY